MNVNLDSNTPARDFPCLSLHFDCALSRTFENSNVMTSHFIPWITSGRKFMYQSVTRSELTYCWIGYMRYTLKKLKLIMVIFFLVSLGVREKINYSKPCSYAKNKGQDRRVYFVSVGELARCARSCSNRYSPDSSVFLNYAYNYYHCLFIIETVVKQLFIATWIFTFYPIWTCM